MGLFDKLNQSSSGRRPKDATSRDASPEEISYSLAYFILPHYVYSDMKKIRELWRKTPESAGAFLYFMACQAREIEPEDKEVDKYVAQLAENKTRSFYVLKHPEPPAVDLSGMDSEESAQAGKLPVLAPYFSCVVSDLKGKNPVIYILGPTPFGGGTTLRRVTSDGNNANLGPGPEPDAEKFLEAIVRTMNAEK